MEIRRAKEEDIETILKIYEEAKRFMTENGNPGQWVNGYPGLSVVKKDLEEGNLYVCTQGEEIQAVFVFFMGEEPNYRVIENGSWINDEPYGVIHRVASVSKGKGVASFCFNWCFEQCGNLRIDTHRDNIPMQKAILKNGFQQCGTVFMEDGSSRIAYQKIKK